MIFPDQKWKNFWDTFLSILILYTVLFLPYRLAFIEIQDENYFWIIFDIFNDLIFAIDIFLNFFCAYSTHHEELITSKYLIIYHYLTGIYNFLCLISLVYLYKLFTNLSQFKFFFVFALNLNRKI